MSKKGNETYAVMLTPHTFTYEDKSSNHIKSVAVAGTFNHWHVEQDLMTKVEGRRLWTKTLLLKPGRYEYQFVLDGEKWVQDQNAEESDCGARHSVVTVGNVSDPQFDAKHRNVPVVEHMRGIGYNQ